MGAFILGTRKQLHRFCDTCGTEPAEQCIVTTPEAGRRFVDLCEKHREKLNQIAGEGAPGDARRNKVYTKDQVERMAKRKARA